MNTSRQSVVSVVVSLLASILVLAGCSGGSSAPASDTSTISEITEIAAEAKDVNATAGGIVAFEELSIVFPAAALPVDARIKISKVSVSLGTPDPILVDMTGAYVVSTTSATGQLELTRSADLRFTVDPAGFDTASIRLVFWDGYTWHEVPAEYDQALRAVTTTTDMILPFGTRIYLANPGKKSTLNPTVQRGKETVSEFIALKVMGVRTGSADAGGATRRAERDDTKAMYVKSTNFTVKYEKVDDRALAEAVSGYMENAYNTIVVQMGFRKPGPTALHGYGKTWPVIFTDLGDAYGRADDTNFIEVQEGSTPGDGLAHTCHHEFTHLVQYRTLKAAGNNTTDGLSWFDETMADAIGFYALKGSGVMYAADDADMGYFEERLDSDEYTIGDKNEDYEYLHFPFVSYLLGRYGHAKFKNFFEMFYSSTPGNTAINMISIDTSAIQQLGKPITGREGIYFDFYYDYFIAGTIVNMDKFKNLPNRPSGAPFEITEHNKDMQGATIAEIDSGGSYPARDFRLMRLSGQVAIFRFKGTTGESTKLSLTVSSSLGQAAGRIRLVPFKRTGGVLQLAGTPEEVSDGGQKQASYPKFGEEVTDIYVVMVNTSSQADGYTVTIGATTS